MGATFSRLKSWIAERLTYADLNAEIDNVLDNLDPDGIDDYSQNSTQMRIQTNPGDVGSESLASSLAGEVERLRYVISRLTGETYWYEAPESTISDLVAAMGTGLPSYRIVSGRTTGDSSQMCALIPSGTTASVTLSASVTPFIYYISGTQYSITANVVLNGLTLASGSNATATFMYTTSTGAHWTRGKGMYGSAIHMSAAQSGITNLVGQIAALKVGTEYFIAKINSTLSLTDAWRGAFFNNSGVSITAAGISSGDELRLCKLAWIFANTSAALAVTYNNPTVAASTPSSASTGDYWFDLSTTAWKTYNSTTWVDANAILIGMTIQDTVACIAARTFDSFKAPSALNTANLIVTSDTQVQADRGAEISVFGTTNRFQHSAPVWDITSDLESGMAESPGQQYFCYMKENGDTVLSDRHPLLRRDLQGLYHPAQTWRALGSVYNSTAATAFLTPATTYRELNSKVMMDVPELYAYRGDTAFTGLYPQPHPAVQSAYAVSHVFRDSFIYARNNSLGNYTAAQDVFQPYETISMARGLWFMNSKAVVDYAGTPAGSSQFKMIMTTAGGTTATTFQNMSIASCLAGGNSNQHTFYLMDAPIYVSEPITMIVKCAVAVTAGAACTIQAFAWAKRIDDAYYGNVL